jgi:hypothetical protein
VNGISLANALHSLSSFDATPLADGLHLGGQEGNIEICPREEHIELEIP